MRNDRLVRWPWLVVATYFAAAPIIVYCYITPESEPPAWVEYTFWPGFFTAPLLSLGALSLALIFAFNKRTKLLSKYLFVFLFIASTVGTYKTCSYINEHIGK